MSKIEAKRELHVLAVDDDPYDLDALDEMLEPSGHRLQRVIDGKTALFLIERARPDLILLDLNMPGFGGLDVLRALKSNAKFSGIPVIMVSSRMDRDAIVTALKLGAVDFLAKPIDQGALEARLGKLVGERLQKQATQGVAWR